MWSGSCLSRSTLFLPGSRQRWVQPGFLECLEMGLQCWCTVAVTRANAGLHPRCWRCVNALRSPGTSPQVKLGSLSGSMEAPACFGAEIYAQVWQNSVLLCEVVARLGKMSSSSCRSAAGCSRMVKASCCTCQVFRRASHLCCLPLLYVQDLGDAEAPIDLKVNFGEQMLVALFRQWASVQQQQQQQQAAIAAPRGGIQQQRQPAAATAAVPSAAAIPSAAGVDPVAADAMAAAAGNAMAQQQVDEDSSMHDADEDAAAG